VMATVKTKLQEFGVFLGLTIFPTFLIVFSVCTIGHSIDDYSRGFIQLLPTSDYNGGLISTLFGSVVMLALGLYILWSAIPTFKEYLTKCGSK